MLTTIFWLSSKAQDTAYVYPRYTAVKWAVQSLLWPGNFIELGVEKRTGKYAGVLYAGVSLPIKYNVIDTINNSEGSLSGTLSGFTVRLEGRRYSKPFRKYKNADFFIGADMFYTRYQALGSGAYTDKDRILEPYVDHYLLNKSMFGVTLVKMGIQQRFGKHLLIEFHLGIGFKVKTVTQQGMFDEAHRSTKIDFNFGEPVLGTEATLAAPLNFCIGYYF